MVSVHERVLDICRTALKNSDVSAEENLIDAGVDSLLAVQIVTRIETEYGIDLVDVFFSTPTVNDLAREIEAHLAESAA